jgi:hypothetical protein
MLCTRRTTWRICARRDSREQWAQESRRRTRRRFVAREQAAARVSERAMGRRANDHDTKSMAVMSGRGRWSRRRDGRAVVLATVGLLCVGELATRLCGENRGRRKC